MKTAYSKFNRTLALTVAILLLVLSCASIAYAAATLLNSRAEFSVSTLAVDAKSEFSAESTDFSLSFDEPGEQQKLEVSTTNNNSSVLQVSYTFAVSATDKNGETVTNDANLPAAILVYLNDDYVGTLAELTSTTSQASELCGAYVPAAGSAKDTITFELHLAASDSVFAGKSVTIKVTAKTENVDYSSHIFVSTNSELQKAIDDINSGLCEIVYETSTADDGTTSTTRKVVYPQIVLLADVSFDGWEITAPCGVDLNGHKASGSATLNGSGGYLWFSGNGADDVNSVSGLSVELTSYDAATVVAFAVSSAKTALADGVDSENSVNILGANSFYFGDTTNFDVDSSAAVNYSYSDGAITASSVERSSVETITLSGTVVEFTVNDVATSLAETYLKNVPDVDTSTEDGTTTYTVVTSDLFLPTTIRSEGATIEWTSGTPDIISDKGKIVAGKADKAPATLYAAITVNGQTTTKEFNFLVSAHTNEVNFYKMVADMSPIVLYETVGSTTDSNGETVYTTGLYELPVVSNGTYDYRKDYKSPSSSSLWASQTDDETRLYAHNAYAEIFLESLTYSEITQDDNTKKYSHIGLQSYENSDENGTGTGYQVYMPSPTIASYAELTVTGTFTTGDSYSSTIIVIIATGSDTTVFDQAFASVSEDLDKINVLQNILKSRATDGILNESGDFKMKKTITQSSITFDLTYAVAENATNSDVIESVGETTDGYYEVHLDLEKLSNVETTVPILVTAKWSNVSKEQILYFTAPAALHTEDFGNASIFNSVKYQVYQQLPDDEKTGIGDAFYISGSSVTNKTPDYVLVRDIVGDAKYLSDYDKFGYVESDGTISYYSGYTTVTYDSDDTSNLFVGCKELWFYTAKNDSSYTDTLARDFAALINWATGTSTQAASSVVTNQTVKGTDLSVTLENTADGKEYLTDSEIEVLEAWYMAATGADEDGWNDVWDSVAERAAGYVMTNGSAVENLASKLITAASTDSTLYFKYTGVMEWATNFKDNTYNVNNTNGYTSNVWASGITSNPEQIQYNLVFSTDDNAPEGTLTVTWSASGTSAVSEDAVEYTYIATIDGVKWYYNTTQKTKGAQYLRYNINGYTTDITAVDENGNEIAVETLYNTKIANYLDDDTSYITPGEAEVIFSFILSQTGKLKVTENDGSYTITNVGSDNTDTTSAFQAYVKTFYASAVIPTYFTDEGISLLLQSFYEKAEISVSTDTDNDGHNDTFAFATAVEETGAGSANSGLTVTNVVENAPAVVNLEQLSSGLSYFSSLEQLFVKGTEDLPAFLSNYGLTTALSSARKNAPNVATLVLEHVADNYVSFSLANIKYFENLTQIDVSDNEGVMNVNPLVNYESNNYKYVDISCVSVEDEFCEFVVENSKATVYYGAERASANGCGAGTISSLGELEDLIAENMYLATSVATSESLETAYWRIESGNKITYVDTSEEMDEILTIANTHFADLHYGEYYGMYYAYGGTSDSTYTNGTIYRIMPNGDNSAFTYITARATGSDGYYYCANTFTYNSVEFEAGKVYRITFADNGTFSASEVYADVEDGINTSENDRAYANNEKSGFKQYSTYTSTQNDVANYEETSDTVQFGYNYFIVTDFESSGYAMFASGGKNNDLRKVRISTGVSYGNTNWETLAPCKLCILTEEDYTEITTNTTAMSCTSVGVASVNDLVCSELKYDAESAKWKLTGTPCAYYLYFPRLGRYVGEDNGDKITTSTSSSDACKFYICKYNDSYMFYYAEETDFSVDASELKTFQMNSGNTLVLESAFDGSDVDINNMWTISDDNVVYGSIASSGKYTGASGTGTHELSNTFTLTVTYTLNGETKTNDVEAKSFYYFVTRSAEEGATSYTYTRTTQAYSGGAIYSVAYVYTKLEAAYSAGTVTYYIDGSEYTIEGATITSLSYVSSLGKTVEISASDLTDPIDKKTYYLDEKVTKTVLFDSPTVNVLSDGAQLTSDFAMDSGTFYSTYSASAIMTNLAANSWTINGTKYTNSDMVGKIFCLQQGSSTLQANNYIKVGGFYTIYHDVEQGTYSLKAVANIDYVYCSTTTSTTTDENGKEVTTTVVANPFARLINMRMLAVLVENYEWKSGAESNGNNAHTGTGGSYTVVVTVFLHKGSEGSSYTDTLRKYQIEVVG